MELPWGQSSCAIGSSGHSICPNVWTPDSEQPLMFSHKRYQNISFHNSFFVYFGKPLPWGNLVVWLQGDLRRYQNTSSSCRECIVCWRHLLCFEQGNVGSNIMFKLLIYLLQYSTLALIRRMLCLSTFCFTCFRQVWSVLPLVQVKCIPVVLSCEGQMYWLGFMLFGLKLHTLHNSSLVRYIWGHVVQG